MSPFARRSDDKHQGLSKRAELQLDLDEKVCSVCRRDLPVWVDRCPDCRGAAVRRVDLPAEEDALLARFLDEDSEGATPPE